MNYFLYTYSLYEPANEIIILTGLYLKVCNKNLCSYLSTKTCCEYAKELSQRDGSFEHPKHMFKLMGKKKLHTLIWGPVLNSM